MKTSSPYKRGSDYPNEMFIQNAIERYFESIGYEQVIEKYIDYVGVNSSDGTKWVIEAKGETQHIGLDFRTSLGQLIQRMKDKNANYGVALPELPQYRAQCKMVEPWVRECLRIHWIFVDQEMQITIIKPNESIDV